MNAPCICPACGQAKPEAARYTLWHYLNRCVGIGGQNISLSPLENNLFFMLYVNMGVEVPKSAIIHALYGDREDGGPLWANTIIPNLTYKLRLKTRLPITGTWRRGFILHEPMRAA